MIHFPFSALTRLGESKGIQPVNSWLFVDGDDLTGALHVV